MADIRIIHPDDIESMKALVETAIRVGMMAVCITPDKTQPMAKASADIGLPVFEIAGLNKTVSIIDRQVFTWDPKPGDSDDAK